MNIIKKIALSMTPVLLALAPYASASATGGVKIEGKSSVRNTTTNTKYADATSAKVDDVVAIQVWYHNMEHENSGKIAKDLKVKIDMPTAPGKTQVVRSTISGANTNTVTTSSTVNLSLDNAYLEVIPGSAQWRHNKGTNQNVQYVTEKVSDKVVGQGLVLENAQPCNNFEATVTILARVKASAVSIQKHVRVKGEKEWKTENTARAGDTLEYMITFKNEGNTSLKNVVVRDNMPPHMSYVPGSTKLKNGTFPNGTKITSDNITKGGIDVGSYAPGANGRVLFEAKVLDTLKCGTNKLRNVGVVQPQGMNEFYNNAYTTVEKECVKVTPVTTQPQTPEAPAAEQPKTEQPAPVTLPETGAGLLAGLAGMGGLGYAARNYLRSRGSLKDALRK